MSDPGAKTINVLMCVDTQKTLLGHTTVYMVDDNSGTDASQGSPELTIHASKDDKIVWRVTGIIPEVDVSLDNFVKTGGADVLRGVAFVDGEWQASVNGTKGTESYHWEFSINGQGGYVWDPFISTE